MADAAKDWALKAIGAMPDGVSMEEIVEGLQFLAKVERGIDQADSCQTISHEEVKQRLLR